MSEFSFYAGEDSASFEVPSTGALGFYNDIGFGTPVPVDDYPGRAFYTSVNGTVEGAESDNVKKTASTSGVIGQSGSGVLLRQIPNYLATVNIRWEHPTPVRVTNAKLRIYDGNNINNGPSGVNCYVAEIIHPDTAQNNNGSGDTSWTVVSGSGSVLDLVASPGTSGLSPSGTATADTRHDWYVVISPTPLDVGSHSFKLYVSCDYL